MGCLCEPAEMWAFLFKGKIMSSKVIRIKSRDEVIKLIKSQLQNEDNFYLSKKRFDDINLILCYGIISYNLNSKAYYKVRTYFNYQKEFDHKLDENNLFNNSNIEIFKNGLKKCADYDYLFDSSFYILTLDEYAQYIYDCYYDLIKYTNSKIYFEREKAFNDASIFTYEEFGIEIKRAELFNFDRYVDYQYFGKMYECIVDSEHVNLNEIFYERLQE